MAAVLGVEGLGLLHLVRAGEVLDLGSAARQAGEHWRQVLELLSDHVRDVALVLQIAGDGEEAGRDDLRSRPFEHRGPDDDVGDSRLVLDGEKDRAAGRAGSLPHQNEARDGDAPAIADRRQFHAGEDASGREVAAHEGHRMGLEG